MSSFVRPCEREKAPSHTKSQVTLSLVLLRKVKGPCSAIHRQDGETKCHSHMFLLFNRWLSQRERIHNLSLQASLDVKSGREEIVKEFLLTLEKVCVI
ncbi:hypothetical protein AVEN_68317-1 [Araneus ventricosus]|uniref:Uncharacterized protein n=1 Tax=Araneus ventricosus TaxID=182803 RepID=A0A4Y2VHN0_ARAVE|nr:hypothetical protein AVEN_68317-1 [Araneus ventricosus]